MLMLADVVSGQPVEKDVRGLLWMQKDDDVAALEQPRALVSGSPSEGQASFIQKYLWRTCLLRVISLPSANSLLKSVFTLHIKFGM